MPDSRRTVERNWSPGWAVVALFGPTSSREKVWLSALVGAAAAWPILVLGVIWPRIAARLLTFASLPSWIPSSLRVESSQDHEAARPGEVDLLLPVRHARRVQPVRRRLDDRAP